MFAGIVSATGEVVALPARLPGAIEITHPRGWGALTVGDSLAVNGCCLTAIRIGEDRVAAEVIPETLRRTNLGELRPGDPVNLEAALTLAAAVGGHLVTGHVDGTGRVAELVPDGNSVVLRLEIPAELSRYCVTKGSLAVDGCSLTIAGVADRADGPSMVEVALIPHTVSATIASRYRVGSRVNLEVDQLALLVERLLGSHPERCG